MLNVIRPYIKIARPDHWFKNVFMLPGVILAIFDNRSLLTWNAIPHLLIGTFSVCLVASSNYVINEILDAPMDLNHAVKKFRPIPAGQVNLPIAYAEWIVLGVAGLLLASMINKGYLYTSVLLLVMGMLYNIPPARLKDIAYLDVLSESVNNPIRLLLGWFVIGNQHVIMISLVMAYWMLGAFLMAVKRYAEYNYIGPEAAKKYRKSFNYYTTNRLLASIIYYGTAFGFFTGIYIVRYHMELILSIPLIAGFISYYLHLGFYENSPTQYPEKLYKIKSFMLYTILCFSVVIVLLFIDIPVITEVVNAFIQN